MNRLAFLVAAAGLLLSAACSRADSPSEADRIKAEAMAAHPTDPLAATKAANGALERRVMAEPSANPRESAAIVFLGYYTKNVYAIPDVCSQENVDLGEFSREFVEANKAPFEVAASVVDTRQLIDRARPSANKSARSELERFASAKQTTLKGACLFIRANARAMADGATFANIMPQVHAALVGREL